MLLSTLHLSDGMGGRLIPHMAIRKRSCHFATKRILNSCVDAHYAFTKSETKTLVKGFLYFASLNLLLRRLTVSKDELVDAVVNNFEKQSCS